MFMRRRLFENVNRTHYSENCLLKYIVSPFAGNAPEQLHQNHWQVPVLGRLIGEYGYNVDVMNWDDNQITLAKYYDLIIDISPHNRHIYLPRLSSAGKCILYATGSAPQFQRRQEEDRLENLFQRRGARLMPHTSLEYDYGHPDTYDGFMLIGNRHTLDTFGTVDLNKSCLIRNTGYPDIAVPDFQEKSPRNFLFFASQPQVLKGLDLLLEVFAAHPMLNLYVCSLFQQEEDFCKVYESELFHCPNIKAIGFVDTTTPLFRDIAGACAYVILPSCSEGISGSVLTTMSAGLIPIVSKECGLNSEEAFLLENCSIDCLTETVTAFGQKSAAWIREHAYRSLDIIKQNYRSQNYMESVRSAFTKLLNRSPANPSPKILENANTGKTFKVDTVRVGIPITGGKYWHGGISYIEAFVKSITSLPRHQRPLLFLVVTERTLPEFAAYLPFMQHFDGIYYVGQGHPELEEPHRPTCIQTWNEFFATIDCYFPVNSDVLPFDRAISWIPDFQHKYLPDLFSPFERQHRETSFSKIAAKARMIIFNSHSVSKGFQRFYPDSPAETRVLHVRPLPEDNWYQASPAEIQKKYQLPERFILCANQFWTHKNHLTLIQALAILKQQNIDATVVCTGTTQDYRAPAYFDMLLDEVNRLGLIDNFLILGLIPRQDQLQLLRRSLFVVQPSLFEGLSLIVHECKALGKQIILSDLDVHLEYNYGTVFNRSDSADLAQKMAGLLTTCQPGPDVDKETQCRLEAVSLAQQCGLDFCNLLLDILGMNNTLKNLPPKNKLRIVTSLSRENIENQQIALQSWQRAGFTISAVNTSSDIAYFQSAFLNVEFVSATQDTTASFGRPYVYLSDLLGHCIRCPEEAFGIVKSDVIFKSDQLSALLEQETKHAVVYGACQNTDSLHAVKTAPRADGFDFIFFDKDVAKCIPFEEFCLGLPWWDYWFIIMAIANEFTGKLLTSPVAFHIKHQTDPHVHLWHKLGLLLSRYAETDFIVSPSTMADYQQLLLATIRDNSTPIPI